MNKKTRLNMIYSIVMFTLLANGVSMSKDVTTVKGKGLTPLEVMSKSEQELQALKSKKTKEVVKASENGKEKAKKISNAQGDYYTTENGYLVQDTVLEYKGIKSDVDKENVKEAIANIKKGKEVTYDATPKKTDVNVILSDDLVIDKDDSVTSLDNIKDTYDKVVENKVSEQKKEQEKLESDIAKLESDLKDKENTKESEGKDLIGIVEDKKDDSAKDTEKTSTDKELEELNAKKKELEDKKAEIEKTKAEELKKLEEDAKKVDTSQLKVVEESVGDDKETYVKVADTGTGKELGWVKKSDIDVKYEEITKEDKNEGYYKLKDNVLARSLPDGMEGSKLDESTLGKKYVNIVSKVTLGNGTVWYKTDNNLYYKDNELDNMNGKEIFMKIGGEIDIKKELELYSKDFDKIQKLNPFHDLNKLKVGDSIIIQPLDTSKVYNPYDYTSDDKTAEFLKELAKHTSAVKSAGLLPSVTFGQAMLESGGGKSQLATQDHNLFGIKGTYKGATRVWETWENYGGSDVTINDGFRVYPSLAESVYDYIDLITTKSRYSSAVGVTDPADAIAIIRGGGYATDPNYEVSVLKTIEKYGLTKLDK